MTKIWGPATWILFHTMAYKIKPQHFNDKKKELISILKNITSNLPCPDCTEHAKKIMGGLKSNSINTKDDFIEMLYYFHNHVNEKLGKKQFLMDDLNVYQDYILLNVINDFLNSWNNLPKNVNMVGESFRRRVVLREFINWFKKNRNYFDI